MNKYKTMFNMRKAAYIFCVMCIPYNLIAYGGSDQNQSACICPPPFLTKEPIQPNQVPPGYLYPGDYQLNQGMDLFFAGEFLYWSSERFYGDIALRTSVTPGEVDSKILIHEPKYQPAFQLTVGMEFPKFDNFVAKGVYTWFHHTTESTYTQGSSDVITPLFGVLPVAVPPAASKVQSTFKNNIDFIQVVAGRPFYLSTRLILNALGGLKAMITNQTETLQFDMLEGGTGENISKTKLWSIGPFFGFDLKGLLWKGFYLVGKSGFTLPYLFYQKMSTEVNFPTVPFSTKITLGNKYYLLQPYTEAGIGMGWGKYFSNCRYHINLDITYDFFATWIINSFESEILVPEDIYMHGLTFKGQLNF